MISKGRLSIASDELYQRISCEDILRKYFGVEYVPSLIHSPLRHDEHKSFSLFYKGNGVVLFKDHASGMSGDVLTLLALVWNCSRGEAAARVWNECECSSRDPVPLSQQSSPTDIQYKIRGFEQHDIEYWNSYGVSHQWLKKAGIVPVSYFVLVRDSRCSIFKADKYAYIFYNKEGVKLYQPFSNIKWLSTQKKNCVQLYNILPESGDMVCVCSSMKDALCLWSNTGIPCIAPQGEGIALPDDVVQDLKHRFKSCYILFDNDKAGLEKAEIASKDTGFTNVVLPEFPGGKDVSDWYKSLKDKKDFQKIKQLFNGESNKETDD